ncbi:hypothetical protein GCM10022243_56480 [Saccharothrix violaceirubra]
MAGLAFVVAIIGGGTAGPAYATAEPGPVHSEPGAGEVLEVPPSAIALMFDQVVDPASVDVTLRSAAGSEQPLGVRRFDGDAVSYPVIGSDLLSDGVYEVAWTAMGTGGTYWFVVDRHAYEAAPQHPGDDAGRAVVVLRATAEAASSGTDVGFYSYAPSLSPFAMPGWSVVGLAALLTGVGWWFSPVRRRKDG